MAPKGTPRDLVPNKKKQKKAKQYTNQTLSMPHIGTQPTQSKYKDFFPDNIPFRLLDLPPEMRNAIYGLVFATDKEEGTDLLRDAEPPPKPIILTNKQVYRETNELYKHAFRSFWTDNLFTIRLDTPAEFLSLLALDMHTPFDAKNVNHITRLSITGIEDYAPLIFNTAHHLRHGGQSWATESCFQGKVDYREHIIGAKVGTRELDWGFLNDRWDHSAQIDHKEGLSEWEADARLLNQLGTAPPLLEQLKFIAERWAKGKDWYDEENWDEAWGSPV